MIPMLIIVKTLLTMLEGLSQLTILCCSNVVITSYRGCSNVLPQRFRDVNMDGFANAVTTLS